VALIGHLQVANECRAALATLTAASSGPIPKAPGSAGGYLLVEFVKSDKARLRSTLESFGYRIFELRMDLVAVHSSDKTLNHIRLTK